MHTDLENVKNLELSGNFDPPQKSRNFVRGHGILTQFRQFSVQGCYCALVVIFCLLDQDDEDWRGNISNEKLRYFDLEFLRNSPPKPGIVREFVLVITWFVGLLRINCPRKI